MNVETPQEITPRTETRHLVQRMQRYSQKCVPRAWQEKKKITQLNVIFHPFAPPTLHAGPICTIFGTQGQTTDMIIQVKF